MGKALAEQAGRPEFYLQNCKGAGREHAAECFYDLHMCTVAHPPGRREGRQSKGMVHKSQIENENILEPGDFHVMVNVHN